MVVVADDVAAAEAAVCVDVIVLLLRGPKGIKRDNDEMDGPRPTTRFK
jgi:hypothetical protein